jgi:hypothetical protein
MKKIISKHERRLVLITDPHIKADKIHKVFKDGIARHGTYDGV